MSRHAWEQAQREAELMQKPWLERNLPVSPPAHAAVSAIASPPKAASFTEQDFAVSHQSGNQHVTRRLDVLSLKVGYSRDAEYALPDEVRYSVVVLPTGSLT